MPKTVTIESYTYDELSDAAKEKARDWYRQAGLDYDWWDGVYEDWKQIFDIIGFDARRPEQRRNGQWVDRQQIYFCGFSCQGDGAQFLGSWRFKAGCQKAIREYAPQEKDLHDIVDVLTTIQRKHLFKLKVTITSGHDRYCHEYNTSFEVMDERTRHGDSPGAEVEEEIAVAFRRMMKMLYRKLEAEYDYLNSDEAVAESITCNEYDFTADGKRCVCL